MGRGQGEDQMVNSNRYMVQVGLAEEGSGEAQGE